MKIFLTGATGFIGKRLLRKIIEEGHKVTVLVRDINTAKQFKKSGVKAVIGDITKPDTFTKHLNNCHTLIHLAAIRSNWGSPKKFIEVNSKAIENFLQPKSSLKHIVVTSSVYAIGRLRSIPADENIPLNGLGIYGESKVQAEIITKKLSNKFEIPFTIIRPAIVYGPEDNDTGMIVKMIKLIKKKRFQIIGNGNNLIHLIYIDDLVEGYLKVIKKGGHNQVYILAGNKPITLLELTSLIKKTLRINYSNIFLPKLPLIFMAFFVENLYKVGFKIHHNLFNKEPFISPIKIQILTDNWSYNISKAKSELGFNPQVDYKEGIAKTVKWFTKQAAS